MKISGKSKDFMQNFKGFINVVFTCQTTFMSEFYVTDIMTQFFPKSYRVSEEEVIIFSAMFPQMINPQNNE